MGTEVQCESYIPGYYSMRDLNENSSYSNWPPFYGDKTLPNGQCYNNFLPRTLASAYPGDDKDALKYKMLEHESIFKHQVYELHRLYKIQRDMMDDFKRKELHKHQMSMETSSSSSPFVSQMASEDAWKWHKPNFPLVNSVSARPSVSSAEIISSPLSCTKGNSTKGGQTPPQNGCSSKDCEILDSRPSKVRKKLFDLQLPAEDYIDTEEGEQSLNNKISDISSYPPSRNHKLVSESSSKLNLGGSSRVDCDSDAARSSSCLRKPVRLADLNEPIQVEEEALPSSVDLIGHAAIHAGIKGLDLVAKPKSQFLLGLPKEMLQNSQHGSNGGTSSNICDMKNGNGREWLSNTYEAGHSKTHLNSFPQGLQPDKSVVSSHRTDTMLNKGHQPSGIVTSDYSKREVWGERTVHGLNFSERDRHFSSFDHLEPVVTSHVAKPYPLVHASNLDNAWSHSVSTWGKPSSSFTEKLTSIQTHPPLNSLGALRSSQSSAQSHEIFMDKWHPNSSSGSKPSFGSGLQNCNGFYNGSSSGSKDTPTCLSSVGFDYFNCNKGDRVVSEHYVPQSYLKRSDVIDIKPANVNVNAVPSKCSSNEVVLQQGLEIIDKDRKHEDHVAVLPWLKAKPASKNEYSSPRRDSGVSFLQAPSNQLPNNSETVKVTDPIPTQKITFASSDREVGTKLNNTSGSLVTRKILGFPIFDNPCTPMESSLISTSASIKCPPQGEDVKNEGNIGIIDINVAFDPESGTPIAAEAPIVQKESDKNFANFRTQIDLNSCVSEDEVTLATSVASTSVSVKIAVEIDLEVPAVPETEDDILPVEDQKQDEMPLESEQCKCEQPQDVTSRTAAEAIVSISSSGHLNLVRETTCQPAEASMADSLLWFAEVVSSHGDDLGKKFGTESRGNGGGDNVSEVRSSDQIDYFEAMTLELQEIKEEEYMPKPLVPENRKLDETGTIMLPNRSRKGARRGRQRRDFQRDILPGLASLSRHEVTEDLQAFGGIMKATGHPWQSGLTRRNGTRNGGGRGRRRAAAVDPAPFPAPAVVASTVCTPLIQQLNNIEVGLEDGSLTGWGKAPRRPRRQRCPAGNPPSNPLT